jgi:hypothetical protein
LRTFSKFCSLYLFALSLAACIFSGSARVHFGLQNLRIAPRFPALNNIPHRGHLMSSLSLLTVLSSATANLPLNRTEYGRLAAR